MTCPRHLPNCVIPAKAGTQADDSTVEDDIGKSRVSADGIEGPTNVVFTNAVVSKLQVIGSVIERARSTPMKNHPRAYRYVYNHGRPGALLARSDRIVAGLPWFAGHQSMKEFV